MIEAALSWLAGKGLALLLGSLVQFVRDALADARAAKAQRDAGRAEQQAADNKAAADAERRAAAVSEKTFPDVIGDLKSGEF